MATQTILIVDDQASMRSALRNFLLAAFPELAIEAVSNGTAALAYCEERVPDLVLMDVQLPDGNGIQFTARLLIRRPGVPVIVVSYHGSALCAERALVAGARAFLPKDRLDRDLVPEVARALSTGPRAACR